MRLLTLSELETSRSDNFDYIEHWDYSSKQSLWLECPKGKYKLFDGGVRLLPRFIREGKDVEVKCMGVDSNG